MMYKVSISKGFFILFYEYVYYFLKNKNILKRFFFFLGAAIHVPRSMKKCERMKDWIIETQNQKVDQETSCLLQFWPLCHACGWKPTDDLGGHSSCLTCHTCMHGCRWDPQRQNSGRWVLIIAAEFTMIMRSSPSNLNCRKWRMKLSHFRVQDEWKVWSVIPFGFWENRILTLCEGAGMGMLIQQGLFWTSFSPKPNGEIIHVVYGGGRGDLGNDWMFPTVRWADPPSHRAVDGIWRRRKKSGIISETKF